MQAWSNLVWLLEWGVALDDGEEWLLSGRGVAGAVKPSLEHEGEGEGEMEWAPAVKASRWDFPAEMVGGDQKTGRKSSEQRHTTTPSTYDGIDTKRPLHISCVVQWSLRATNLNHTAVHKVRVVEQV